MAMNMNDRVPEIKAVELLTNAVNVLEMYIVSGHRPVDIEKAISRVSTYIIIMAC
jgi:hypothetical protein